MFSVSAASDDAGSDNTSTAGLAIRYLDEHGNPKENKIRDTATSRDILTVKAHQNVDWRNGIPRTVNSELKIRAAAAQRRGIKAPDGMACDYCANGNAGPFETCRVLVTSSSLAFEGACCACAYAHKGNKCTLREHYFSYLVVWAALLTFM